MQAFDERELELVIGGLGKIDLQDWKTNTRLKHCTVETPQVKNLFLKQISTNVIIAQVVWFWNIVGSYSEEMRARLLQFVTGSSRVPLQGFKALQVCRSGIRDLISIYFRHRDPLELLDLGFSLFTLWMLTPAISPKHTPASIGAISPSSRLISHRPLFRLDLPPYPSEEKMMDKLTQAVEETCGFAVE